MHAASLEGAQATENDKERERERVREREKERVAGRGWQTISRLEAAAFVGTGAMMENRKEVPHTASCHESSSLHEPTPRLGNLVRSPRSPKPKILHFWPLQLFRCVGGGCLSENYLDVGSYLDAGHAFNMQQTHRSTGATQVTTIAWSRPAGWRVFLKRFGRIWFGFACASSCWGILFF